MADLPKHIQLLDACRTALKPLFRIMLRSGISYKDFNEVSKSLFVEIATKEYGLRGRDTNVSRVAIMTGLTRKEVKKIRDAGWANIREDKASTKIAPAASVLHYWHTDEEFLDDHNRPLHIPYEGQSTSFLTLAKRYGGDVPPGALFKELIRSEAVDTDNNSMFYPIKRHFIPVDIDTKLLYVLENGVRRLLESIDFNTRAYGSKKNEIRRIERWVIGSIPRSKIQNFAMMIRSEVTEFCESMDSRIAKIEAGPDHKKDKKAKSAGIGIYYFEDD